PIAAATETVHLKRSLGRWDLVALFVVAVANLNVVPVIAAEGPVTIWLWILALLFFFWPQGMAVVELSNRYPQEGGIGTAITSVVLVGLAVGVLRTHGGMLHPADFSVRGADWHLINSFGFICFGLVGLELASVMGDEIEDPKRNVPSAVLWGGLLSGILYIVATLSLLLAVPHKE